MDNEVASQFKEKPKTKLGKWSVGLNTLFLIIIATSLVLVLALKKLSFNDHWWDATVPIAFLIEMVALVTGILAVKKNKERSVWIYISILTGVLVILFALLHSLFISD
ncbi:MAG: hypothetical protein A2898_03330 [Candidatus Kerfeldbacteria bacterium RIFCSPLOWO2_01_FULL_48_11]|uniref:Uncharacterized protein n=1 Tax=Candidatus Kerfeldbacteria bacterium RIFCSPLOWO2_01_FULL_48_11 TaxID=1798543 RepID=A0A1G2B4Z1_9BACT|nr:MAG: hypothetical protein UY34_C0009G0013 [Parcubacteria group bacterium GW2011_GWA2_48_9]KKW16770.1 MAG: hypothetical protein UY52_C0001G0090 [Parcubacteria group bacterium GW2011_GWC2_49_9]OGY83297.1 MAG: hypothetical protein A2898_03330 [Candidatus Kerfeldbacteria bacterium RIFCSPLOWO2_01_FULL_48_11]HCJ52250.1 hypothetical protein [Candidatus Kerfeldbacteria bacterium]